jgi:hypothetical protein
VEFHHQQGLYLQEVNDMTANPGDLSNQRVPNSVNP